MKIVAIHGIANQFEGSETIRQAWLPALNSGLQEAGFPPVDPSDFVPIFFGGIFRPKGTRGSDTSLSSEDQEWLQPMLLELTLEAVRLSEQNRGIDNPDHESPGIQSPDEGSRSRAPRSVQALLRQLSKSRFFKALHPERFLLADLLQVRRFLHEPLIKETILKQVDEKVGPGTRVILGHSLGSVVGYEALCRNPGWQIDTFVSLGSPLGIRNLVFDALTPRPQDGRGVRPNVKRWVNIADAGDIVALQKDLSACFDNVEDARVYNGWASHDVRRYLTAPETGAAIGRALSLS